MTGSDTGATCFWMATLVILLLLSGVIMSRCVAWAHGRTDPAASFFYQPYDPPMRWFEETYTEDPPPRRNRRSAVTTNTTTASVATGIGGVRLAAYQTRPNVDEIIQIRTTG